MPTVEFVVNEDGSTEVGVTCVQGKACQDITKEFEKALGTVKADKKTPEFYEKEEKQHATHRR